MERIIEEFGISIARLDMSSEESLDNLINELKRQIDIENNLNQDIIFHDHFIKIIFMNKIINILENIKNNIFKTKDIIDINDYNFDLESLNFD